MFTIKTVGRVRPGSPERPNETAAKDWKFRRWAGAPTDWYYGGFERILDLGHFSIEPGESPLEAAKVAFEWQQGHGFEVVHVGDFADGDDSGHCLIGHRPDGSTLFVNPSDTAIYILGENGQTVDRL